MQSKQDVSLMHAQKCANILFWIFRAAWNSATEQIKLAKNFVGKSFTTNSFWFFIEKDCILKICAQTWLCKAKYRIIYRQPNKTILDGFL